MRFVLTTLAILAPCLLFSQQFVERTANERWWGMAISKEGTTISRQDSLPSGAYTSQLVSSSGRYIAADEPFVFAFEDDGIRIKAPQPLKVSKTGKTLRDATLLLSQRNNFRQEQSDRINYVVEASVDILTPFLDLIKSGKLPNGDIIVKGWESSPGSLAFADEAIAALLTEVSNQGFNTILEVSPLIAAYGDRAKDAMAQNLVVKGSEGEVLLLTDMGFSLIYDLANPTVATFYNDMVSRALEQSASKGILYNHECRGQLRGKLSDNESLMASVFAANVENILLSNIPAYGGSLAYQFDGASSVQNFIELATKLPYGNNLDFVVTKHPRQQSIWLSLASALMSNYNIFVDKELLSNPQIVSQAMNIRSKLNSVIESVNSEHIKNGAPIIRHMEYEFPQKGFGNCLDQFMIGSKILVAPHTKNGGRMVRLPNGRWRDSQGHLVKGPAVIVAAQSNILPYYERVK